MKKKYLQIAFFLFIFTFEISAQTSEEAESKRYVELTNKLEGTYQVQIIDSRDKTEIPLYIMDTIQAKRHASNVVYFPLKSNVRVMILPFAVINDKNFKPIERIANISSEKTTR